MRSRPVQRVIALAMASILVTAWPIGSLAYKSKAHVATANAALGELDAAGTSAWIRGLGLVPLHNDEIMAAVRKYPDHFRAGTLGPDSFPDLIAGQLWVHVNGGCKDGPCGCPPGQPTCLVDGRQILSSDVRLEDRSIGAWRSIDYGMYQLFKAMDLSAGAEREQALAFSYGYLAHELSDGFAHAWVDEWARDYFGYFRGSGLFGPITEEIQHIAVESYLDKHLRPSPAPDLTLNAPYAFLDRVYLEPVDAFDTGHEVPLVQTAPAGAFAGPYYQVLTEVRDQLFRLADHHNWDAAVSSLGPTATTAASSLLSVHDQLFNIGGLGTDLFNPITDIEDYFERRGQVVDALLRGWVRLSGCTSQNLILGANLPPGSRVTQDACQLTNFEAMLGVGDIFEGELNEAAWYGQGEAEFDYGSLGNNLQKMLFFLGAIESVALRFSILEDVASIRRLMEMFAWCDQALLQWGSCQKACASATQDCSRIVPVAACAGCPTRHGHYSCNPWYSSRRARCIAFPWCFGCQHHWFDVVADATCSTVVHSAAPLCGLCTPQSPLDPRTPVCTLVDVAQAIPEAIDRALQPLVDRIKDEVKDRVLQYYFGPNVEAFVDAFREIEHSWHTSSPAWIVNIAFLREDLRADPAHLSRIIAAAIHVSESAIDNSAEMALAIESTFLNTKDAAKQVLQLYLVLGSDSAYEAVWRQILTLLYRIAREQSFDAVYELRDTVENTAYEWLDQIRFRESQATYDRRLAKFIALFGRLRLLSDIRGPAALALRSELGLETDAFDRPGGVIEPHAVHVLHNTIELVKLGFLGRGGIDGLLARAAPLSPDLLVQSGICRVVPYVGCDVVQSLDDPSNVKFEPASGEDLLERRRPDPELSVARWYPNTYKWSPPTAGMSGFVAQSPRCVTTLTDFPLAASEARVAVLYDAIFRYPPTCPQAPCAFQSCSAQGFDCGVVADGCNGYQSCGTCSAGDVCSANRCCTPTTCAAQGKNCGAISNACGGTIDCGSCSTSANAACTNNVCTCAPDTCASIGRTCGSVADGCGGTLSCGTCPTGAVCTAAGACCVKKTCSGVCGTISDGCGGWLSCGGGTVCSGVCTNLETDRRNCGACGRVCPSTRPFCDFGVCVNPYL